MNEINKPDVKFNPVVAPKPIEKPEADQTKTAPAVDAKPQDYKEAAAAPGAEAAGRAQVMLNKADNINSDIQKIIDNPSIVDKSDTLFNAAEKAGVPYPAAATFATTEVAH